MTEDKKPDAGVERPVPGDSDSAAFSETPDLGKAPDPPQTDPTGETSKPFEKMDELSRHRDIEPTTETETLFAPLKADDDVDDEASSVEILEEVAISETQSSNPDQTPDSPSTLSDDQEETAEGNEPDLESDPNPESQPEPEPQAEPESEPVRPAVSEKVYWQEDRPGPTVFEGDLGDDDEIAEIAGGAGYLWLALALIAAVAALRVWMGGRVGLGDAEAYYTAWSRVFDWSYYDHAPGIAWLIRLGRYGLGETVLAVRLASIVFSTATALLVYTAGATLFESRRVGFWAVLLFLLTPAMLIGGMSASPDVAFGFFWVLAAVLLHLAVRREQPKWLIGVGLAVGFGLLCKYFMILFWPVAVLYLLFGAGRKQLFSMWFLIALALSAVLFAPVLFWNWQHDWVSFAYHLGLRHSAAEFSEARLGLFAAGQLLYLSPVIGMALFFSVFRSLGNAVQGRSRDASLLFWLTVPVLVFFYVVGAWTPEAEPHWALAGYLLLYPVLAHWALQLPDREAGPLMRFLLVGPLAFWMVPRVRRGVLGWLVLPALLINAVVLVHVGSDVLFAVIPESGYNPKTDISNELVGWDRVGLALRQEADAFKADFAGSYHYTMCGQVDTALKGDLPLVCASKRNDAFDFLPDRPSMIGKDGLFVTDNRYSEPPSQWAACAGGIARLHDLPINRAGRIVRTFTIWGCRNYRGLAEAGTKAPPVKAAPVEVKQPLETQPETVGDVPEATGNEPRTPFDPPAAIVPDKPTDEFTDGSTDEAAALDAKSDDAPGTPDPSASQTETEVAPTPSDTVQTGSQDAEQPAPEKNAAAKAVEAPSVPTPKEEPAAASPAEQLVPVETPAAAEPTIMDL